MCSSSQRCCRSAQEIHDELRAAFGDLQQEGKLTRPPKGFDADTPHAEYVRHKSFIVWNERSVDGMTGDEMEQVVLKNFRDAQPLVQWLRQVPTDRRLWRKWDTEANAWTRLADGGEFLVARGLGDIRATVR